MSAEEKQAHCIAVHGFEKWHRYLCCGINVLALVLVHLFSNFGLDASIELLAESTDVS